MHRQKANSTAYDWSVRKEEQFHHENNWISSQFSIDQSHSCSKFPDALNRKYGSVHALNKPGILVWKLFWTLLFGNVNPFPSTLGPGLLEPGPRGTPGDEAAVKDQFHLFLAFSNVTATSVSIAICGSDATGEKHISDGCWGTCHNFRRATVNVWYDPAFRISVRPLVLMPNTLAHCDIDWKNGKSRSLKTKNQYFYCIS